VEKAPLSANKAMPGTAKGFSGTNRLALESPPKGAFPGDEENAKAPQQKGFQGVSNEPPPTSAPVETAKDSSGPSRKQQVSPAPASGIAMPQVVPKKTPQRKLKGVHPMVTKLEVRIMITADGPIENYETFLLDAPPRFVLDVSGKWKNRGPTEVAVLDRNIRRMRIGEHEDKLRIVMDLNAPEQYPPSIVKTATGLAIILSRSPGAIKPN
jgi:hypothetical protein